MRVPKATRHLPPVACRLVFLLLPVFLCGCERPFGLGYRIESEALEVRYSSAPAPRLAVHCAYRLTNTGQGKLEFVDATLPEEKSFGRRNLRVQVNGRDAQPQLVAGNSSDLLRIGFDPVWPQNQQGSVVVDYDLGAGDETWGFAVAENGFLLQDGAWYPRPLSPKAPLSRVDPARRVDLSIVAPEDFRVFTNGRPAGVRRQKGAVERRFRLGQEDFAPFVIAGRYQERPVEAAGRTAVFWTFEQVQPDVASRIAARLAVALKAYEQAFGPLPGKLSPVRVTEIPGSKESESENRRIVSLPGIVLAERGSLAEIPSEESLENMEERLARSWFGHLLRARPEARLVLGKGAIVYATIVAAEAREGQAARQHAVEMLLRDYDAARAAAGEKPLSALAPSDSPEQRRIGENKAALFFIALEDRYGEAKVRRALSHLIGSLRGQEAGFSELRSAVEEESGQDTVKLFNSWLNQTGIPAEFRNRYSGENRNGS